MNVPGLIGEIADYITEINPVPQKEFSFACGLALQAHLIGRKYKTEDNIRSNIYVISVGKTGSGKNSAVEFLRDKNIVDSLIGLTGTFASYQAVISSLTMQPEILTVWDELGSKLAQIQDRRNINLVPIIGLFTELYSSSKNAFYPEIRVRKKKQEPIIEPHLSLYATGATKEVFRSFTTNQIENGFLGRIHFFLENPKVKHQHLFEKKPIPESIFETIKKWIPDTKDLFRESITNVIGAPTITVSYTSEAIQTFRDYAEKWTEIIEQNDNLTNCLWVRTSEEAKKLALIYACSVSITEPIIDKTAAAWGCKLSEHLTMRKCYITQNNVADTEQAGIENEIIGYLLKHGKTSQTMLANRFKSGIAGKHRDNAIKNLLATGQIVRKKETNDDSRKVTTYFDTVRLNNGNKR